MSKADQYLQMILDTKEWHDNKVGQLQQIVEMKDTSKILFEGKDGEKVALPEEHSKGFIMGIQLALEVIGKFPISISKEE